MSEPNNSTTTISDAERIEQLLKANEQLQAQLASLSALYASLARQHASDALVSYGQGKEKRWLNARSIRVVWLVAEMRSAQPGGVPAPTNKFAVRVDDLRISAYLPLSQAEKTLDAVAETLNRVLQPPE